MNWPNHWWRDPALAAHAVALHGTPTQAAKAIGGISHRTFRDWWHRHLDAASAPSSAAATTAPADADPAEVVQFKRTITKLEQQVRDLGAQLKVGIADANVIDEVRGLAAPLLESYPVIVPKPTIALPKAIHSTPIELVVYLADWHVGEVIHPSEVEGHNAYDLQIAAQRVEHIGLVVADWLANYSRLHPVERITFVGMGDLVNNAGVLHPDQSTDYARVLVQSLDAALLARQLIEPFLLVKDLKVRWVSTAGGNHGRSNKGKMPSGPAVAQTSWDQVVYEHLAAQLRGADVEWVLGRAYSQVFEAAGQNIWVAHGHGIKGGGGALGLPVYGTKRANDAAVTSSVVQAILEDNAAGIVQHGRVGHFHQLMEIRTPTGTFKIVPSIKGTGPWELEVLGKTSEPEALLEVFHPRHGIMGTHPINCRNPRGTGYVTGALTSSTPAAMLVP